MKLKYSYLSINNDKYSNYTNFPKLIEHATIDENEGNDCKWVEQDLAGEKVQVMQCGNNETNTNNEQDAQSSNENIHISTSSENNIEIPKYSSINTYVNIEITTPAHDDMNYVTPNKANIVNRIVDKVIPLKELSDNNKFSFYDKETDINCDNSKLYGPSFEFKTCEAKGYESKTLTAKGSKGWIFSGNSDTSEYKSFKTEFTNFNIIVYGVKENEEVELINLKNSSSGFITNKNEGKEPSITYKSAYDEHKLWNSYFENVGHTDEYILDDGSLLQEEENLLQEEENLLQEESLLQEEEKNKIIESYSGDYKILDINKINKTICGSESFPNHDITPNENNWKSWIKNRKFINPFNICEEKDGTEPEYDIVDGVNAEEPTIYKTIQPIKNESLDDSSVTNQVKFTFSFSKRPISHVNNNYALDDVLVEKPSYNYNFKTNNSNPEYYISEDQVNDVAICKNTESDEANGTDLKGGNSFIKISPYTNATNGLSLEFYIYWKLPQDILEATIFDMAFSQGYDEEINNIFSSNLIHVATNVNNEPHGYCGNGVIFGKYCCADTCGSCGGINCSSQNGGEFSCCTEKITRPCNAKNDSICVIPDLNEYVRFGNFSNIANSKWYNLGGDSSNNIQYSYESNKWTHVVMTVNKSNILQVYLDGNLYNEIEGNDINLIKSGFRNFSAIGCSSEDIENEDKKATKMKIKSFRIWNNYNLTEKEIKKLYENKEIDLSIFKSIKETSITTPSYNFEFRKNESNLISDNINRIGAVYNDGCYSTLKDGLILDGVSGYLKFDENIKINGSIGFTIEFFAKIDKVPSTNTDSKQTLMLFSESIDSESIFSINQSESQFQVKNNDSSYNFESLNIGFWTHYVYVISFIDNEIIQYIDGKYEDSFEFNSELGLNYRLQSYIGGYYPDKYEEQWYETATNFYSLNNLVEILNSNMNLITGEEDTDDINVNDISNIYFYKKESEVKYCRVFIKQNNMTFNSYFNYNNEWVWYKVGDKLEINSNNKEIYPSLDLAHPTPKRFSKMKMKYLRIWNDKILSQDEIIKLHKFRNTTNIFSYTHSSLPNPIPNDPILEKYQPYYDFDFRTLTPVNILIEDNVNKLRAHYKNNLESDLNNGIKLDETTAHIEIEQKLETIGDLGFSIEFYAYFYYVNESKSIFWFSRESNWENGRHLGIAQIKEGNDTFFMIRNEKKSVKILQTSFFEWSHYILTISSSGDVKFYINGKKIETDNSLNIGRVENRNRENSYIGAYYPNNVPKILGFAKMSLKYLRVWNNIELLESEVEALYRLRDNKFNKNIFKNELELASNIPIFEETKPEKILLISDLKVYSPHHNFDFRTVQKNKISDKINSLDAIYKNGTESDVSGAKLDGNRNYIELSDFELGHTFSIEILVKIKSIRKSTIFDFNDGDVNVMKDQILLESQNNMFKFYSRTGTKITQAYSINNIGSFNNDDYVHLIITIDGLQNIIKFYQNGQSVIERSNVIKKNPLPRRNHLIGKNFQNNDNLEGNLKYFRIWKNYVLSNNDVDQLYEYRNMTEVFIDNTINTLPIQYSEFDYTHFTDRNGCFSKRSVDPTLFCDQNNKCETVKDCNELKNEAEQKARKEAAALREILIEAENRELREERQKIRKEEAAFEAAKIAEEERLQRERDRKKAEQDAITQAEKDKAIREAQEKAVRDKEKADREAAFRSSAEKAAEEKRLADIAAANKVIEDKKISDRAAAESKAKAEKGTSYRDIASSGSTRGSSNDDKAGSLIGQLTGSSNAPDIARANEKANQGGGVSIYLILILLIVITCLILKKYYS